MENGYDIQNHDQHQEKRKKHSAYGIACFIISIVAILMIFGVLLVSQIINPIEAGLSEDSFYVVIGLIAILGGFLSLIGLGLGIYGVVQKNRKRVFSVLGVIFNVLVVIFVLACFFIGSM